MPMILEQLKVHGMTALSKIRMLHLNGSLRNIAWEEL